MRDDPHEHDEFDDERPHYERDHRGGLILAFGILSLVLIQCGGLPGMVFGVLAWVMGNGDLRGMAAGEVDPEGKSITNAGRILGIVGVILGILYVVVIIVYFVVMFVVVAAMPQQGQGPAVAPPPPPPPIIVK